jgi:hypothetical protein
VVARQSPQGKGCNDAEVRHYDCGRACARAKARACSDTAATQRLTAYLEGHIQVRPDEDSLALELRLVKIVEAGLAVSGGGGLGLGAGGSIALHSSERRLGNVQCTPLLRSGFAVSVED